MVPLASRWSTARLAISIQRIKCGREPVGIVLKLWCQSPCKVQVPQRLCPRLLTDELRASLAVPVWAPGASRADFRFEFHRKVVLLADTADNSPVPPVPVPPLCKDGGAALELHVPRSPDGSAAQLCVDDKLSDRIPCPPERYLSKHLVKLIQLRLPTCILDNSSVLPENTKVGALNSQENNEGRLTTGGRQSLMGSPKSKLCTDPNTSESAFAAGRRQWPMSERTLQMRLHHT